MEVQRQRPFVQSKVICFGPQLTAVEDQVIAHLARFQCDEFQRKEGGILGVDRCGGRAPKRRDGAVCGKHAEVIFVQVWYRATLQRFIPQSFGVKAQGELIALESGEICRTEGHAHAVASLERLILNVDMQRITGATRRQCQGLRPSRCRVVQVAQLVCDEVLMDVCRWQIEVHPFRHIGRKGIVRVIKRKVGRHKAPGRIGVGERVGLPQDKPLHGDHVGQGDAAGAVEIGGQHFVWRIQQLIAQNVFEHLDQVHNIDAIGEVVFLRQQHVVGAAARHAVKVEGAIRAGRALHGSAFHANHDSRII